jgi:predicted RNA-binding protein with TRAM domain
VEIPEDLLCLYTARIEDRGESHVVEVPDRELTHGDVEEEEFYRVALIPTGTEDTSAGEAPARESSGESRPERDPPVDEGERRTVEIENLGDQGDGIARVERGYVVIVPDTDVGDEVEIEIEELHPNFAMGRVVEGDSLAIE